VYDPTTTYDFRVSAHTISTTTTAATGNMYIQAVQIDPTTGTTLTISIWADVYCVSVLGYNGEVRGHIYRTDPDLLTQPTDLVFDVSDLNPFSSLPDTIDVATDPIGTPCIDVPTGALTPVAKGDITVNDEGP
jgi:hypothetical protein